MINSECVSHQIWNFLPFGLPYFPQMSCDQISPFSRVTIQREFTSLLPSPKYWDCPHYLWFWSLDHRLFQTKIWHMFWPTVTIFPACWLEGSLNQVRNFWFPGRVMPRFSWQIPFDIQGQGLGVVTQFQPFFLFVIGSMGSVIHPALDCPVPSSAPRPPFHQTWPSIHATSLPFPSTPPVASLASFPV